MKVIASTDKDTVLCSVTMHEMAVIAGYSSVYDKGWESATQGCRDRYGASANYVGLEILPLVRSRFHSTIESSEKQALDCATTLRALADLITRSLPRTVIRPEADHPRPETEASS